MTAPRITAEEIADFVDLVEEQRRCGTRGAGSRSVLMGKALRRLLDAIKPAYAELDKMGAALLEYQQAPAAIEDSAWREVEYRDREIARLRSELDRLSAQGGGVPELTIEDFGTLFVFGENGAVTQATVDKLNRWIRANSRPAPPHPDTVEVSRAILEHLVSLREPKAGEEEGELLDVLSHALRAQAQPATEREAASCR